VLGDKACLTATLSTIKPTTTLGLCPDLCGEQSTTKGLGFVTAVLCQWTKETIAGYKICSDNKCIGLYMSTVLWGNLLERWLTWRPVLADETIRCPKPTVHICLNSVFFCDKLWTQKLDGTDHHFQWWALIADLLDLCFSLIQSCG
jgi:hypothetical protein